MSHHHAAAARRAGGAAAVALALLLTAGCSSTSSTDTGSAPTTAASGSDGTSGSTGTTGSPGTSDAPTTSKAPPSPEVVSANLAVADIGAGWVVYPEEAEVLGEEEAGGCARASGLLDDLPADRFGDGAILQFGDRLVFAQTVARIFPTPAEAQAFAAYLLSPEQIECRRAELEEGLPAADPPLTVVSTGTDTGDGTTPYVGSFFYETQQAVDGATQAVGASRHAIYVKGSTVVDLFTQIGGKEGDPTDLSESTDTMIDAGMQLVLARIA